jgi:cellulase/cellobiase CelA1
MAATWFTALRAVPGSLGGNTPPTSPPPTSPPPTSPPPTTPPPGNQACTATYSILNQWQGGFQGGVTVTAGSAAISAWTVRWTFPNGQAVTQFWSTTLTSSGSAVTASNVSYNGSLAAGGTAQFGFLASWSGTNGVPTPSCTAT